MLTATMHNWVQIIAMDYHVSLAGIVLFVLLKLGARMLSERAVMGLSAEQKVSILEGFSRYRAFWGIPSVVLALVAVGAMMHFGEHVVHIAIAEVVCLLALTVGSHVLVVRKLQALAVPDAYMRRYLVVRTLTHAGALVLFASLMYPLVASYLAQEEEIDGLRMSPSRNFSRLAALPERVPRRSPRDLRFQPRFVCLASDVAFCRTIDTGTTSAKSSGGPW